MTSSPSASHKTAGPSPGNRTETVLSSFLLLAVVGFLLLFLADARQDDTLASIGRVLHWAAGTGILATTAVTRTVLRRWASGFDWILAAMWILLTILTWANGEL